MFSDTVFVRATSTSLRERPGAQARETEEAIRLVQGEYLEVPTLQLTLEQIQRLWNLEVATTRAVVRELCDRRFLRQTPGGPYVRATRPLRSGTPRNAS